MEEKTEKGRSTVPRNVYKTHTSTRKLVITTSKRITMTSELSDNYLTLTFFYSDQIQERNSVKHTTVPFLL